MIVHISSGGGVFNKQIYQAIGFGPAYSTGKAAVDRMAVDMAADFEGLENKIYAFSLWPGMVKTEIFEEMASSDNSTEALDDLMKNGESPRLTGRCLKEIIDRLTDDNSMQKFNGKIIQVADVAKIFQVKDIDGKFKPRLGICNDIETQIMSRHFKLDQ